MGECSARISVSGVWPFDASISVRAFLVLVIALQMRSGRSRPVVRLWRRKIEREILVRTGVFHIDVSVCSVRALLCFWTLTDGKHCRTSFWFVVLCQGTACGVHSCIQYLHIGRSKAQISE